MPWSSPVEQRKEFIADAARKVFSVTELCDRYGVSRKTGYKWLARHESGGVEDLADRSRRPKTCPHQTPDWVQEHILDARRSHPRWGPKKLLIWLVRRLPWLEERLPCPSTTAELLRRHGLVSLRRRRRSRPPSSRPITPATAPNTVWAADFKGEFSTGDGLYCFPLTITDAFSRYLLTCKGLPTIKQVGARRVFERTFQTYGLPEVMLTDNGVPFASTALGRLSTLSVWWIRLGIRIEHSRPGTPSDNGRHERMHRTLKASCTRPPARSMRGQQRLFDIFQREYNEERPHEALGQETPASFYEPSPRVYPARLPPIEYPGHYLPRLVCTAGTFRFKNATIFLTHALELQWIGLYEVDDGVWSVNFGPVELGRYDERRDRFHPGGAPKPNNRSSHTPSTATNRLRVSPRPPLVPELRGR